MRKTSLYLSEAERRRLADLARLEGIPQAEVIREAMSAYEGRRTIDREFRLQAIGEGPGGAIADVPEEKLLDGFGEYGTGAVLVERRRRLPQLDAESLKRDVDAVVDPEL